MLVSQRPVDILSRLQTRESTTWIFRLRVFSVLKDTFAWNVESRRPVKTNRLLLPLWINDIDIRLDDSTARPVHSWRLRRVEMV
jgi:hypothetical protein